MKCTSCKNYRLEAGCCVLNDELEGYGMNVNEINRIWGISFEDCNRCEVIVQE